MELDILNRTRGERTAYSQVWAIVPITTQETVPEVRTRRQDSREGEGFRGPFWPERAGESSIGRMSEGHSFPAEGIMSTVSRVDSVGWKIRTIISFPDAGPVVSYPNLPRKNYIDRTWCNLCHSASSGYWGRLGPMEVRTNPRRKQIHLVVSAEGRSQVLTFELLIDIPIRRGVIASHKLYI